MAVHGQLVSVIMPCHQQERYVRQALRSVLAQDYSPLEIIALDDASTDRTYEAITAEANAYRGPHRIRHGRSRTSLRIGIYNKLLQMAEGRFIVNAHGDDISQRDRITRLVATWRGTGASLVASNAVVIGADGRRLGLLFDPSAERVCTLEDIFVNVRCRDMLGATFGYDRAVLERFGPLDRSLSVIRTDIIMPFRAALLDGCAYLNDPVLMYRFHRSSAADLTDRNHRRTLAESESNRAEQLSQLAYLIATIENASDVVPDSERRNAIRTRLLDTLAKRAQNWARLRNQLVADGYRSRWVAGDLHDLDS